MSEESWEVASDVRLSLENFEGAIRVYGSEGNRVHLKAVRRAYSRARLEAIDLRVSATAGRIGIKASVPGRPAGGWKLGQDRSGVVDLVLFVPVHASVEKLRMESGDVLLEGLRGRTLRTELGNGRLVVRNCFSTIDVSVRQGVLALGYDWWEPIPFLVRAVIDKGSLRFYVPGSASFRMDALAPHGAVHDSLTGVSPRVVPERFSFVTGDSPAATLYLEARRDGVRLERSY